MRRFKSITIRSAVAILTVACLTAHAQAQDNESHLGSPWFGDINNDGVPDMLLYVDVNDLEGPDQKLVETPDGPRGENFKVQTFYDTLDVLDIHVVTSGDGAPTPKRLRKAGLIGSFHAGPVAPDDFLISQIIAVLIGL